MLAVLAAITVWRMRLIYKKTACRLWLPRIIICLVSLIILRIKAILRCSAILHALALMRGLTFKIKRLKGALTFERFTGVLKQSRSSTQLLCKASLRQLGSFANGLWRIAEGLGAAHCEKHTQSSRHQSRLMKPIDSASCSHEARASRRSHLHARMIGDGRATVSRAPWKAMWHWQYVLHFQDCYLAIRRIR